MSRLSVILLWPKSKIPRICQQCANLIFIIPVFRFSDHPVRGSPFHTVVVVVVVLCVVVLERASVIITDNDDDDDDDYVGQRVHQAQHKQQVGSECETNDVLFSSPFACVHVASPPILERPPLPIDRDRRDRGPHHGTGPNIHDIDIFINLAGRRPPCRGYTV